MKITDFGVSAILDSTSSVADTFTGTYVYMSVSIIILSIFSAVFDILARLKILGICFSVFFL